MARLRYNGLAAELGGSGLAPTDTTITFAAALTYAGGAVPTLASPDTIALSILDADGSVVEIVSLTAYTSGATTGTIARAQESTTAATHAAGVRVVHSPTAADFTTSSSGGGGGSGTTRPLVDPTGLAWSWINQGVATIATEGAALLLNSPQEGADNWHFRAKAVPAKPYSVIIHQLPAFMGMNFSGVCVGWLQSSNNNFAVFDQRGAGLVAESSNGSGTSFAITGNMRSNTALFLWEWVKLTDDATNRRIYVSRDGYNWILFHSVATNTTITPDRLIFGLQSRNDTYGVALTVDSWEEVV